MHRNLKIDTEKVRQRLDNVHLKHELYFIYNQQSQNYKKKVRRLDLGYAIWVLFAVV